MRRLQITLEDELYASLTKEIKELRFGSYSHAINYALSQLLRGGLGLGQKTCVVVFGPFCGAESTGCSSRRIEPHTYSATHVLVIKVLQ